MEKPLEGLKILDLTQYVAGPYYTMLLADAGAEVVKVEPPSGEVTRSLEPILEGINGESFGGYFLRLNRNKRSICLDLKKEQGVEVFKQLVREVDVVTENFRPGVMERLGIGYEAMKEVNPDIVYVSITGFGNDDILPSPYKDHLAFAVVAEAMGGILSANPNEQGPPIWTGFGIGDIYAGMMAANGLLMAIYRRDRNGKGAHVDISMYDAMVSLNERAVAMWTMTKQVVQPGKETLLAPFGLFKAVDGYVSIACIGEKIWYRFCEAIERDDLKTAAGYETGPDRARNLETHLRPIVESWLTDKTRDEATSILSKYGVPAGPAHNAQDLFSCPHVEARNMLPRFTHPIAGEFQFSGNPIKISDTPNDREVDAPPLLGADTVHYLREWLHYDENRLTKLQEDGVIKSGGESA